MTNDNLYKYALSKIYYNKNTIYYIYADTHCNGKLKIEFDFNLNDISIEDYKIKNLEITKEYDLEYKEHNYYVDHNIKDDLKYKPIVYIIKNAKYKLLIILLKEEAINNKIVDSTGEKLYSFISNKYENFELDCKKFEKHTYFKKEILKYKNDNNLDNLNKEDLKKIITLRTLCSKINSYINYYEKKNKKINEQLLSIKLNNEIITK